MAYVFDSYCVKELENVTVLTLQSPVVNICTTRCNIIQLYILHVECIFLLYVAENKRRLFAGIQ
jgi:hypothetical protein